MQAPEGNEAAYCQVARIVVVRLELEVRGVNDISRVNIVPEVDEHGSERYKECICPLST